MQDINSVNIIGRLIKDIEIKYLTSGVSCGRLTMAVNENRKSGDKWEEYCSFIEVTIWGKQAENLKPYLTKSKQIAISGHLQQQRWEKDGQKNSKIIVIADNIQLLGGHNGGGNNQQQAAAEPVDDGGFAEDMPF